MKHFIDIIRVCVFSIPAIVFLLIGFYTLRLAWGDEKVAEFIEGLLP